MYLKLTPDPQVAATEAAALRAWRDCPQVVRLLDVGLTANALLLEGIEPGTPLRHQQHGQHGEHGAGPGALSEVAPELLRSLRSAVPDPPAGVFPTLRDRVDFLFGLTVARWREIPASRRVPLELVDRCHDAGRELSELSAGGPRALVHGDLHPGDVLDAGPARGYVAIDPRRCVGDPDFDAIDWVVTGATDVEQMRTRVAHLTARVTGLDAARVWGWCRATAVVIAVSHLWRATADDHTRTLLTLAAT